MKKFGGMSGDELQRPRQFEHENAWLKRALAEGMLDNQISKERSAKKGAERKKWWGYRRSGKRWPGSKRPGRNEPRLDTSRREPERP